MAVAWVAMAIFLLMICAVLALKRVNWTLEDSMMRAIRMLVLASVVYGVSAEEGWIPTFGDRRVNIPLVILNAYLVYVTIAEGGVRVFGSAMTTYQQQYVTDYVFSAQIIFVLGAPVTGAIVYLPFVFGLVMMFPPLWFMFAAYRKSPTNQYGSRRIVWLGIAVVLTIVDATMLLLSQAYMGRVTIAGGIVNMMTIHVLMMGFFVYTEKHFLLVNGTVEYSPHVTDDDADDQ